MITVMIETFLENMTLLLSNIYIYACMYELHIMAPTRRNATLYP